VKILLLTHRLPWPLHDGYNLHNLHHARELATRHEVHLVSVGEGELPPDVHALFSSVQIVPLSPPPRRGLVRRVIDAWSVSELYECEPRFQQALDQVVARERIDVLWASGSKPLVYTQHAAGLPVVADLADDESREALHDLRAARTPRQCLQKLRDAVLLPRFQLRYLAHAAVCTVVSEDDQRRLRHRCPWLDVRVVPNGVDATLFAPGTAEEEADALVFEGSMDHPPNSQAMVTFCRDVLPILLAARPGIHLTIVGRSPGPEVEALSSPHVTVTGLVDDVRPYLDRAAVFVCPLRRGSGMKNKILQAWAMEKAVVATSRSCGGLDVEPGRNLELADTPPDIARVVLELLGDPDRRRRLGEAGRSSALAHSTWQARSSQLERVLEDARAAGPRGGRSG